ncbi:MAG: PEP-CTERM sorting domain-containing protein [Verrucomicrobium sp.]
MGALLLALASFAGNAEAVTLAVSGGYDENAFATNSVDSQAPGNALSSASFGTAVSSAFTSGMGGVINFDRPNGNNNDDDNNPATETMIISYGSGKSFNIKSSAAYDIHNFSSLKAISGYDNSLDVPGGNTPDLTHKGIALTSASVYTWTLDFGAITGGIPGEAITTAGFTLLSRDLIQQDVTIDWFLNGSSISSAAQTDNIKIGQIVDDTFFSYSAPTNSYISGVKITFGGTTGDLRLGIDDLGFITSAVPEPSRVLLLSLALTGCVLRRRR